MLRPGFPQTIMVTKHRSGPTSQQVAATGGEALRTLRLALRLAPHAVRLKPGSHLRRTLGAGRCRVLAGQRGNDHGTCLVLDCVGPFVRGDRQQVEGADRSSVSAHARHIGRFGTRVIRSVSERRGTSLLPRTCGRAQAGPLYRRRRGRRACRRPSPMQLRSSGLPSQSCSSEHESAAPVLRRTLPDELRSLSATSSLIAQTDGAPKLPLPRRSCIHASIVDFRVFAGLAWKGPATTSFVLW